jgi:hypothetical protein
MTTRHSPVRRAAVAALVAGAATLAGATAAGADHVHSKETGNGACVLLAQHSGEGDVDLPFATDAQVDANRAHPIHLLVHLGEPGEHVAIGVVDTASDPCLASGDYVNR